MSRRIEPREEMISRILSATETVVIREGLQNLSMRNIAKEAGIASGTLYLYFKTKEDLLHALATQLLDCYASYMHFEFEANSELYTQYEQLFKKKWLFLTQHLELVKQFQAVVGIDKLIQDTVDTETSFWNRLISEGKKRKLIVDLPNEILYALSIGTLVDMKYLQRFNKTCDFEAYLDDIILRTWKAITI